MPTISTTIGTTTTISSNSNSSISQHGDRTIIRGVSRIITLIAFSRASRIGCPLEVVCRILGVRISNKQQINLECSKTLGSTLNSGQPRPSEGRTRLSIPPLANRGLLSYHNLIQQLSGRHLEPEQQLSSGNLPPLTLSDRLNLDLLVQQPQASEVPLHLERTFRPCNRV